MTITVTMSAVCLSLVIVLYFSSKALSDSESSGVQWRDCGEAITIQCRSSEPEQELLNVKKGLSEYVSVFFKKSNSEDITIAKGFMGRLQVNGEFPDIDVLIENLTSADTGPYWCLYKKSNKSEMKGIGSVLLVVEGEVPGVCNTSVENLVLIPVVISTAVVLSIIMGVLIWLLKAKTGYTAVKPGLDPINYVYEVMNGTLTNQPANL